MSHDYQYMYHNTSPDLIEKILEEGLKIGMEISPIYAAHWVLDIYGTNPIYLSIKPERWSGDVLLQVNVQNVSLVADLPTLLNYGAYLSEDFGGFYWEEAEPKELIPFIDEDGYLSFDGLLIPDSSTVNAAIELTGTAATLKDIPPERITLL